MTMHGMRDIRKRTETPSGMNYDLAEKDFFISHYLFLKDLVTIISSIGHIFAHNKQNYCLSLPIKTVILHST